MKDPIAVPSGKRLFAVSDIHGHYKVLVRALHAAGFDENDPNHIFLSCGDLFDRGRENRKVYDYIRSLKRKILVRGNHDERLVRILRERRVKPADHHNRTLITLREFFGENCIDADDNVHLDGCEATIAELTQFVASMRDYYETEHYVFVHGWIPTVIRDDLPCVAPDWRNADDEAWYEARWSPWPKMYAAQAVLAGKTIVCGHRCTRYATIFDPARAEDDDSMFRAEGIAVLDAGTIESKKINVLVIDGEV